MICSIVMVIDSRKKYQISKNLTYTSLLNVFVSASYPLCSLGRVNRQFLLHSSVLIIVTWYQMSVRNLPNKTKNLWISFGCFSSHATWTKLACVSQHTQNKLGYFSSGFLARMRTSPNQIAHIPTLKNSTCFATTDSNRILFRCSCENISPHSFL